MVSTRVTGAEGLGTTIQSVRKSTDDVPADQPPAPNRPPEVTLGTPAEMNEQIKSRYSTQEPTKALDEPDLSYVSSCHRDGLRQLLLEFTGMWDGSLVEFRTIEHRIDFMPTTKPFSQPPYTAGSKAREEEATKVERIL